MVLNAVIQYVLYNLLDLTFYKGRSGQRKGPYDSTDAVIKSLSWMISESSSRSSFTGLDCQPAILHCVTLGRRPKSISCWLQNTVFYLVYANVPSNVLSITRAPGNIFQSHLCGLLHNCVLYTNCLNATAISPPALDATHPHSRYLSSANQSLSRSLPANSISVLTSQSP